MGNKLSIYLIKEKYSEDSDILKNDSYDAFEKHNYTVYYDKSHITIPKWKESFFGGEINDSEIYTSNARAVVLYKATIGVDSQRVFALTFGYGRNMIKDEVIEEAFGLKVVLNSIPVRGIRRLNKTNIGGNLKTSNEQLPLDSNVDDFGFDIDRDLISNITGRSNDDSFVKGMITGGEAFSCTVDFNITNVETLLTKVYARYLSKVYKEAFSWVDYIRKVKNPALIRSLDEQVIQLINNKSHNAWMAVPEVLSWEEIAGFKYSGSDLFDDIAINGVIDSLGGTLAIIDQLKKKKIHVISAESGNVIKSWSAYKCLYVELAYEGYQYCLNNGKWFCVDQDFVEQVNNEYINMQICDIDFPVRTKEQRSENEYSQAFVKAHPIHYILMDAKTISYGGGRSKFELCDILSDQHVYIHVKPYTGSSTLSHLFNQAVNSAELVLSDQKFRDEANDIIRKITENSDFLLDEAKAPRVVFAIISNDSSDLPQIPFFSKMTLRYAVRRLKAFGCEVSIKNIRSEV